MSINRSVCYRSNNSRIYHKEEPFYEKHSFVEIYKISIRQWSYVITFFINKFHKYRSPYLSVTCINARLNIKINLYCFFNQLLNGEDFCIVSLSLILIIQTLFCPNVMTYIRILIIHHQHYQPDHNTIPVTENVLVICSTGVLPLESGMREKNKCFCDHLWNIIHWIYRIALMIRNITTHDY